MDYHVEDDGNGFYYQVIEEEYIMAVEEQTVAVPDQFTLYSPSPNPFNACTKIRFSLPHSSYTSLTVHNLLGQKVSTLVDGFEEAGEHQVVFDADDEDLSGGVYFVQLEASERKACRKIVLFK